MFFVPEKGDEVVVAFAHGDMRLPIILGGVYNGQDKPPSHRDASTDEKMIRTKGKHEILLNDSKDSQQIKLTTNGGHVIDLNDKEQSVSIKTSGGQSITLDDKASSITVKTSGGQSITLDPTGGVTISAPTITVQAESINLGQLAHSPLVLGDLFMAFFNLHTHNPPTAPTPLVPTVPMTPALLSLVSKTGKP